MLLVAAGALVSSGIIAITLRYLGIRYGLIDHPDDVRKLHDQSIPLTGGLSLLVTLLLVFIAFGIPQPIAGLGEYFWPVLAACLTVLVLLHAIDDVVDLNPATRFAIDTLLALAICLIAAVRLTDLEDLFGFGTVWLGRLSIPMTVFCFVAASNAFNMSDGIDGLCSGLGIVCFSTLLCLIWLHEGVIEPLGMPLVAVISAIVPLYLLNTGWFGRRFVVFLGDSGARLIGFIAAVSLVVAGFKNLIQPATAFFPLAVPVCDCLVLMGWRIAHGRSPTSPDRLHLHHLLMDVGLSENKTRIAILGIAVAFSICGFVFEISKAPAWMISVFIVAAFCSFVGMRIWLYRLRSRAA